jgi:hypothetical protein
VPRFGETTLEIYQKAIPSEVKAAALELEAELLKNRASIRRASAEFANARPV